MYKGAKECGPVFPFTLSAQRRTHCSVIQGGWLLSLYTTPCLQRYFGVNPASQARDLHAETLDSHSREGKNMLEERCESLVCFQR